MSRPFPVGVENPPPVLRRRARGRALRRRAARRRRRPRSLRRRGRARADRGRVRAARAGARSRARARSSPTARSPTATPTAAFAARRPRRLRALRLPALDVRARSSATASSRTGTRRAASLTAWANFQGPFTLHSVAAAALGLHGSKLRLITPPNSGGSFGIKATVYVYVVLIGLASRKLGVPVRWTEDRLEHLAGSSASTARDHRPRGRVHVRRRAARAPLRRARGRRRVRPRARAGERSTGCTARYRAPTASPHVAARNRVVLTNRCPTGLNRGFGGPQLYLALERTMAIAARPARARPGRARAPQPDRRGRVPVPHAVRRALRLGRLRGLPRRRARARPLRRAARGAARGARGRPPLRDRHRLRASSRRSRTWATSRSRRRPRSAPPACPSRGTRRARRWRSPRSAASPCGSGRRRRDRGTRRSRAQVVADALGVEPEEIEVLTAVDTSTSAWTVSSGNYSSRFSGVGAGAVHLAAQKLAAKIAGDPRPRRRRVALAAPGRRDRALEPGGAAAGDGAGAARDRVLRRAEPRRPGRGRPRRLVGRARVHRRRRGRRGRPRDRAR